MRHWDTVAIVGVGLIGGSIGLALRRRKLARNVVGIGRRKSSLSKALQVGAVSRTTTSMSRGVVDAELTIVCTPVGKIVQHVREVAESCPKQALVTDAGSTKASIVSALGGDLPRGVRFLGSHPLAGSEKTGPENARDDLFENRLVVITPTRSSKTADIDRLTQFWTCLGAEVICKTPQAHDAAVAVTSHLPHLVAAAMAAAVPAGDLPLTGSGWLDTTRIASGDVQLWRQILTDNRAHTLKALGKFEKVLASFRAALEENDSAQVARLLQRGKERRDAVGS